MNFNDLEEVNEEVNSFTYVSDPSRYNTPEFWSEINNDGGDCEDFAIGKLNRLVKLGWPIEKLRIGTCYVETGEYHAVLVVETDKGDYVLDNRQSDPFTMEELYIIRYRPDRIQRVGGSREWMKWA